MDIQDVLTVIQTEKACVLRNENGQCDRECYDCNLVLPTKIVLSAYDYVIDMLKAEINFYDPDDHDPDVQLILSKSIDEECAFEELVHQRGKWKYT